VFGSILRTCGACVCCVVLSTTQVCISRRIKAYVTMIHGGNLKLISLWLGGGENRNKLIKSSKSCKMKMGGVEVISDLCISSLTTRMKP
jgi:hypothetical protein